MIKLNDNYKTSCAKAFTELAIQNDLISVCGSAEDTANEICKFYKTIFENLDPNEE
ncbi:hypothetical protein [Paraclostridium sordellii]|uniref:hypothetical protein n=1 Tax=Paraclostridium sordellii TaxID=1505 RepID=UPI0022E86E9D|nr:hypothetical protein [Paeniclostridium sordellii]